MNKKTLFLACFLSCLSFVLTAQDEKWEEDPSYSDNIRHTEVLMNLTPLVAQFVPFNASTVSKLNIFDFEFRRLRNGRGTRFSLGANIDGDIADAKNHLYLRYGFIKSYQLSQRLHYFRSWDANLVAEDTDNFGRPIGKLGFSGLAVSYSIGIQYSFSRRIAISTESSLFVGLLDGNNNNDGPRVKFIPPVGLFIHVKL